MDSIENLNVLSIMLNGSQRAFGVEHDDSHLLERSRIRLSSSTVVVTQMQKHLPKQTQIKLWVIIKMHFQKIDDSLTVFWYQDLIKAES